MRGQTQLMSSARTGAKAQDEWRTPRWLFDRCVERFGTFNLDAAASDENHLCDAWFTEKDNALEKDWFGNVWCNPPYSMLRPFANKAVTEIRLGHCESVTFLIPARTDTRAFQWLARFAGEIVFLAGRVKFEPGTHSAPFPSVIVVIAARDGRPCITFEDWRVKP